MKIDIINQRTNNSISLDSYIYGMGVLITSFLPGNVPATFNKVKGINQQGSSLLSTTVENREVGIEAIILGSDRVEIETIKRTIDDVLNPIDNLVIKYTDDNIHKEIKCSADATPLYSTDYKTNNDYALAFQVSFECFNPFWVDQEETILNIETWGGGIEFELELVSAGVEFAIRGLNQLDIINYGNVKSPLEIFFKGPALNPSITVGSNFIKVNRAIADDEILYINTSFNEKAVEVTKNGITERAYHYVDIDSNFFDLEPGSNTLSYATDGNFLPQSVIIKYKGHYFSL